MHIAPIVLRLRITDLKYSYIFEKIGNSDARRNMLQSNIKETL